MSSPEDTNRKAVERLRREEMGTSRLMDQLSAMRGPSREESQAKWNAIELRQMYSEQGRNLVQVIKSRVEQLQSSLMVDEELAVYYDAGGERLRIHAFEFPTWNLAIAVGFDGNGNIVHRIESVQDVKLTLKVMKSSSKKRAPIGFALPDDN